MSQGPPLTPPLMYTDIWANQPAATVLSALLGPNPRVNYVNGNTALGGFPGARQRVHADLTFNHAQLPFGIVTNYYLTDTDDDDDRSTAYDPTLEVKFGIREELVERRRAYAPPIQPVVRKGSVILRDLRLWHAGVANPSPVPRIMLAFVHTPWWYQCPARVVLPEACRGLVREWAERAVSPVCYRAEYVPADVDHKTVKFSPTLAAITRGTSGCCRKMS
ncbi:unnamed protein product [Parascedosporium putredinis]|uniref:Phytanoyl-CoA dioxygenase n=1 Tax=Parascedosporium putredinis TaxID=1442378 RepID=A0A9P1M9E6_9PEZI|nr:unnamed protein product [Parascedosporium putredinis]CAI7991810.1 unnamed protein product [Parascedosporium putredinis]